MRVVRVVQPKLISSTVSTVSIRSNVALSQSTTIVAVVWVASHVTVPPYERNMRFAASLQVVLNVQIAKDLTIVRARSFVRVMAVA